jgi:L-arabinose isomerase
VCLPQSQEKKANMIDLKQYSVWFVTGSQHLYGPETLKQVAENADVIVRELNKSRHIPFPIVFKPVVTSSDMILNVVREANNDAQCAGLILWMHTFSPAKMWIAGLTALAKPFLHLHTQFNQDIPWDTIDMNFMNLNQAAHGDREFGFICTRLRKSRKVVVGHWLDQQVHAQVGVWMRVAAAVADMRSMRVARWGDNMRDVAVTEGDKVEAQAKFGYSVNGYGIGDLVKRVKDVSDAKISALVKEYEAQYTLAAAAKEGGANRQNLVEAARIELGMRAFLEEGKFSAFTTTFEDLNGLVQLPGLAVQRLMADGYGFGAEGDWKTAAMVRAVKVMSAELSGGTSFMEDYTYHLEPGGQKVLGAHMLEVCSSIGTGKASLEVHHLGIGGKDDPPRLVFDVPEGAAMNVSLIDMGDRFRLITNTVKVVRPPKPLPKLPVARALWIPLPDLKTAAAAWIYAGGAHHTVFSQAVGVEYMDDFAEIMGIEHAVIDERTSLREFKNTLRWNDRSFRP